MLLCLSLVNYWAIKITFEIIHSRGFREQCPCPTRLGWNGKCAQTANGWIIENINIHSNVMIVQKYDENNIQLLIFDMRKCFLKIIKISSPISNDTNATLITGRYFHSRWIWTSIFILHLLEAIQFGDTDSRLSTLANVRGFVFCLIHLSAAVFCAIVDLFRFACVHKWCHFGH